MRSIRLRPLNLFLAILATWSVASAQGASDSCSAPQSISGRGTFAFDTTAATTGAEGQLNSRCAQFGSSAIANDVWFVWTSSFTGTVVVTTCGQTGLDTKLAVYPGSSCPAGAPLACNDDFCSLQSYLAISVTAGSAYTIQVGHYTGTSGGTGTFTITALPTGTDDDCGSPTDVVGAGPFAFDLAGATTGTAGQQNSVCSTYGTSAIAFDRWFRWTAPVDGSATLGFCGTATGDVRAAVYTATACPLGSAIACADDVCGVEPAVSFPTRAGQTYVFQIGARPGTGSALGSFTIASSPSSVSYGGLAHVALGTATVQSNGSGGLSVTGLDGSGQSGLSVLMPPAPHSFCVQLATATCPFTNTPGSPAGTAMSLTATNALQEFAAHLKFTSNGTNVDITADFGPSIFTFCNQWTACDSSAGPSLHDECLIPGPPFEVSIPDDACISEVDWRVWNTLISGFAIQFEPATTVTFSSGQTVVCKRLTVYPDDLSTPGGPVFLLPFGVPPIDTFSIQFSTIGSFDVSMEAIDPPVTTGTPFCFGDGTGTACPCGNTGAAGNGCASSVNAAGGNLSATGTASVSADTLVFHGSGMPNSSALYFQGTTQVSVAFGDGLRCVAGSVIRLGVKSNTAGSSAYPMGSDLSVSVRGLVPPSGATRKYQCWYRNAAAFCTPSTFNLTNGIEVTWTP